jgi:hypothetical protein
VDVLVMSEVELVFSQQSSLLKHSALSKLPPVLGTGILPWISTISSMFNGVATRATWSLK